MLIPVQVTFRNMDPSSAVEEKVRERASKLERRHANITRCHVVIEAPHRHHHKGRIFRVSVDLTIPGAELATSGDSNHDHAHEDVYVAIRDAFMAVERRLEHFQGKREAD